MKRIYVIVILAVLILAAAGVAAYKFWFTDPPPVVWDLVPESAIVVYESANTVQSWNHIQAQSVWHHLEQIPYYANIGTGIETLDSLSGKEGQLDRLVQGKPFVFSLHRTAQNQLGVLFFVRLDDIRDFDVLKKLISQYQSRDDFTFQDRNYQNFTIHEAVNPEYQEVFSYVIHQNYFIGSFTSVLVEDVIRNISNPSQSSFSSSNPQLSQVAKLENDQGNLYINTRKIPQLLAVFTKDIEGTDLSTISNLAESTYLDIKMDENQILLNGFTLLDESNSQYLYSVSGTQGHGLGFKQLLTRDVAHLYHLTFNDSRVWHDRLKNFWKQHQPAQLKRYQTLEQLNWDPGGLVRAQSREIGLAVMETLENEPPDRIAYLKCADFNEGLMQLNRLSELAVEGQTDSLYREEFGSMEIRQLSIDDFPRKLWGELFSGFNQTFYMPYQEYLLLSNSIQALKDLVKAVEAQDTWGKTVKMEQFLESSLPEANLSYYLNLAKSWSLLETRLSAPWQQFFQDHEKVLKGFDLLNFQFMDIGDKFYTSGIITYSPQSQARTEVVQRFQPVQQVTFNRSLITRPFVVRNHNNGNREVFIQDSAYHIHLISSQGRILWSDSLPSRIQGEVSQVDYYKNNKLQYLLATAGSIHLIDRNGNSVEGFPVSVPTETVLRNLRAIDYDNSKNYRLIASDDNGQIYMLDKQGKLLEGWNPKRMDDQLLTAPQHIRVRGRDCIIAVQENGMIHVMNRRGRNYSGFPLDLKGPTRSPLFIEIGTGFNSTYITTINSGGTIIKFNLEGGIVDRKQLVKPSGDTQYQLHIDPLSRNYVISRQNANRLALLDRSGNLLFEKDYLSSAILGVQYYLFSDNRNLYAVTDPVQQFTYFYRDNGILVNSMPIENSLPVSMLYFESQQKHQVYSAYDHQFSIYNF